ncbi:MAG: BTAD domain-containing putative transcriptional regulator [Vicinamibacterales bacterium]
MLFGVLGPLAVGGGSVAGDALVPPGARVRRLLALLVLEAPHPVGRLAAMDWVLGSDAANADGASAAFNVTLSRLRRWLRDIGVDATISSSAAGIRLVVADEQVDHLRFTALLDPARRTDRYGEGAAAGAKRSAALAEALALWRGDVAAGEDLPSHPVATALTERRLAAIEEQAERATAAGPLDPSALSELLAWCERAPQRERLWAAAMHALYLVGRQVEALALFQRARAALVEELGLEPGPKLCELEQRILRHDPSLRTVPDAGPTPSRRRSTDLDRLMAAFRTSTFFGRAEEISAVRAHLEQGAPVVTVLGAGGAGKSRLSVEAVLGIEQRWPDGVVLVPLAKVTDPALVADAVVSAFGAGPVGEGGFAPVAERWSGLRALLVLDTCEHVVDAVAELCAVLVECCPYLQVLATSREPLRVAGEVRVPVDPLPVPGADAEPAALEASPAVQLFVDRAAAVGWRPGPGPSDVVAVGEVCRRLDGLPLAIEIVAARADVSGPGELLAMLGGPLRAERALRQAGEQRHRTVADSIRWSFEQLSDAGRRSLAACAVFAGGFDAGAAGAVADADPALLIELTAKSLVVVDHGGDATRYRLLDTIREFAGERLDEEPGLAAATGERLLGWALALSRQAATEHFGPEGTAWHRRLDVELPNLRVAMAQALAAGRGDLVIELTVNLHDYFWWARGRLAEPKGWLERALTMSAAGDEHWQGRGLFALGGFLWAQFEVERAEAALRRARGLAERTGDRWVVGRATLCLAQLVAQRGDPDAGWADFQRHREDLLIGFPGPAEAGISYFEGNIAAQRGDDETAERLLARCYELASSRSAVIVMTRLLPILARRRRAAGEVTTSDALLVEACCLARRSGDVAALVRALLHRADLALEAGAHAVAAEVLAEAKQLLDRGIEAPAMVVRFHRCAGRLAAATGEAELAAAEAERARLLALALAHPRVSGATA